MQAQAVRGCELRSTYIVCFQCEGVAEGPRLCPRCTKCFCNECLLSTITALREECPSCSCRVREQEYLQPEAVVSLVNSISDKVKREMKRGQQRQQCAQHQLTLSYFCVDCNQPLCADCGLLTSHHTGHRFVSYRDIYERIKRAELKHLRDYIFEEMQKKTQITLIKQSNALTESIQALSSQQLHSSAPSRTLLCILTPQQWKTHPHLPQPRNLSELLHLPNTLLSNPPSICVPMFQMSRSLKLDCSQILLSKHYCPCMSSRLSRPFCLP